MNRNRTATRITDPLRARRRRRSSENLGCRPNVLAIMPEWLAAVDDWLVENPGVVNFRDLLARDWPYSMVYYQYDIATMSEAKFGMRADGGTRKDGRPIGAVIVGSDFSLQSTANGGSTTFKEWYHSTGVYYPADASDEETALFEWLAATGGDVLLNVPTCFRWGSSPFDYPTVLSRTNDFLSRIGSTITIEDPYSIEHQPYVRASWLAREPFLWRGQYLQHRQIINQAYTPLIVSPYNFSRWMRAEEHADWTGSTFDPAPAYRKIPYNIGSEVAALWGAYSVNTLARINAGAGRVLNQVYEIHIGWPPGTTIKPGYNWYDTDDFRLFFSADYLGYPNGAAIENGPRRTSPTCVQERLPGGGTLYVFADNNSRDNWALSQVSEDCRHLRRLLTYHENGYVTPCDDPADSHAAVGTRGGCAEGTMQLPGFLSGGARGLVEWEPVDDLHVSVFLPGSGSIGGSSDLTNGAWTTVNGYGSFYIRTPVKPDGADDQYSGVAVTRNIHSPVVNPRVFGVAPDLWFRASFGVPVMDYDHTAYKSPNPGLPYYTGGPKTEWQALRDLIIPFEQFGCWNGSGDAATVDAWLASASETTSAVPHLISYAMRNVAGDASIGFAGIDPEEFAIQNLVYRFDSDFRLRTYVGNTFVSVDSDDRLPLQHKAVQRDEWYTAERSNDLLAERTNGAFYQDASNSQMRMGVICRLNSFVADDSESETPWNASPIDGELFVPFLHYHTGPLDWDRAYRVIVPSDTGGTIQVDCSVKYPRGYSASIDPGQLLLNITGEAPSSWTEGELITLTFHFENDTYSELADVGIDAITPAIPDALITRLALAAGATDSFDVTYALTAGDVAAEEVAFSANGSGDRGTEELVCADVVTIVKLVP